MTSTTFEAPTNLDDFRPMAPPPAAPPPPPPPSYGSTPTTPFSPNANVYDSHIEESPATRQAKRGLPPDEGPISSFRGDTSLRPNIGSSNAAIGEESLRESMWKMRLVNLTACVLALLSEIPNFMGKVFTINLPGAVLGGYLTFFALLLLGYELDMWGADRIKEYFGLLHHPIGRAFVLLLMGGLSVGQGGIINFVLGAVFLWSSGYTFTTFVWFPEYRRKFYNSEERESLVNEALKNNTWATPENITQGVAQAALAAPGEAASLIQKAMKV